MRIKQHSSHCQLSKGWIYALRAVFFIYNGWGYLQVESFDNRVPNVIVFEYMADSYCQLWVRENCQPRHIHHVSDFPWELCTSWLQSPVSLPKKWLFWSSVVLFALVSGHCPILLLSQAGKTQLCHIPLSHHFLSCELIPVLPLEYLRWSLPQITSAIIVV